MIAAIGMSLLSELFVWWNGQTLGTRFFTWRRGTLVGTDEFGNRYYRDRRSDRRWVIYGGPAEASRVPPDWHGWLHHTVDARPDNQTVKARPWQLPHRPNMTGTPDAWRPPGSALTANRRPPATGDYDAWSPAD